MLEAFSKVIMDYQSSDMQTAGACILAHLHLTYILAHVHVCSAGRASWRQPHVCKAVARCVRDLETTTLACTSDAKGSSSFSRKHGQRVLAGALGSASWQRAALVRRLGT